MQELVRGVNADVFYIVSVRIMELCGTEEWAQASDAQRWGFLLVLVFSLDLFIEAYWIWLDLSFNYALI